ncbi:MAG: uridine kinase [Flavobacteriales bacterium]
MKIIGISGVSGSGKSRLCKALAEYFGSDLELIHQDHFYNDQSEIAFKERLKTNYDEPQSVDFQELESKISKLSTGKPITIPQYNFAEHSRSSVQKSIEPKPYILVEGTMIFESEKLNTLFDVSIYVDTDLDIAISRRIARDVEERGRTVKDILAQYLATVRPGMLKYTIKNKEKSDFLFSGNQDIMNHLNKIIKLIE